MADEQGVPEPVAPTRGAQVRLDGDAQTAARGGFGYEVETNTVIKQKLENDGVVADGYTPDGTTRTGEGPKEPVLEQVAPDPAGPTAQAQKQDAQPQPAPAPAPAAAAPAPKPAPKG